MKFVSSLLFSVWKNALGPSRNPIRRGLACNMANSFPAILTDHSQRTANNFRQNVLSEATVIALRQISPSVKSVLLQVHDKRLNFKAGQWIDAFFPGVDQVGGFSMVSPPFMLEHIGQMELAIKYSSWPPAHWVHTNSHIGVKINIRVGGNFHYEPPENAQMPDMVFVAGGVGINPLLSIIRQLESHKKHQNVQKFSRRIKLLYSAKMENEILFKDTIFSMKQTFGDSFDYKFFVTGPQSGSDANFLGRRITEIDLQEAIGGSDKDNLLCFLCGPPPMTDAFISTLQRLGVPQQNIRFEKWW